MISGLPNRLISPVFLVLVVVILIGIFVPMGSSPTSKKLATPSINFETLSYPSRVWQERVLANAKNAALEKDANKRFELYGKIFRDLSAIYDRDHSAETRTQLESLAQFIAEEFVGLYNPQNFTVPCLDLECATASYPTEIDEVKTQLQSITSLEPLVLDSVMKKFEAAALTGDANYQWQNYIGAFQEIKAEMARTKDEKIVQVANKLKDFLKTKYPDVFSQRERDIPNLFKI